MNTKKKTIKNLISILTCFIMFVATSFGLVNLFKTNSHVEAVETLQKNITNQNFNESTRSTYPYNPTGFDAYINNTKVEDSSSVDANAGVINLSNDKYKKTFENAKRNDSYDSYVLMINSSHEEKNSQGETVTKNESINFGYRTNSNNKINLSKNSNYTISADVFTSVNSGIANLYLYDANGKIVSSITNISSNNTWTTKTFFVKTNEEELSLSLGLNLNGQGVVLFDNISCNQLSNNLFSSRYELAQQNTPNDIKLVENKELIENEYRIVENQFINKDVSKSTNKSAIQTILFNASKNSNEFTETKTIFDSDGTNSTALLVNNIKSTYVQHETNSLFTFNRLSVYKVSVNIKVSDLNGKAYLKLVRTDNVDSKFDSTITISSNSSTSSNVQNDYETRNFYIYSNPKQSATYKLVFGLGDKDNETSGKLYIGGIKITKVNFNAYENASDTTDGKIDLTSSTTYKNNDVMLDNANFNAIKISDATKPLPATPTDWTVKTGKNEQKYGVVNTSEEEWTKLSSLNLNNLINPSSNEDENVLMMYNSTGDTLSYLSTSKSLSSNTYHKFTLDIQTQHSNAKVSLVATVNEKEVELTSVDVNTNYQWKNIQLYLHTGSQDLKVSLKITLDSSSYAYCYIDNATFDYLNVANTQEKFDLIKSSTLINKVDLNNILTSNSNEQWSKPAFFESEDQVDFSGAIDLTSESLSTDVISTSSLVSKFKAINENNVLGIRSHTPTNFTYTSKLGYSVVSGKFYKLSLKVFTQFIDENTGAGIKLSNFDEKFTNVNSNEKWTEYTFYINPDNDATIYLSLSLGEQDNLASGDAFFGAINFETSDIQFANAKDTLTSKVLTKVTTEEEQTTAETNEEKSSNINWIYLIPTLLFVVAIIAAIVGVALRKVKFKKHVKKTKTTYDRNKTVSKQVAIRKATTEREKRLRELQIELDKLHQERQKYEDGYKSNLTTLREMKLKRKTPQEIAKFEKQMKRDQKYAAQIGLNINRVQNELAYTKTDNYLNSLAKKFEHSSIDLNKEEKEN